jgi:hypothetical protein
MRKKLFFYPRRSGATYRSRFVAARSFKEALAFHVPVELLSYPHEEIKTQAERLPDADRRIKPCANRVAPKAEAPFILRKQLALPPEQDILIRRLSGDCYGLYGD